MKEIIYETIEGERKGFVVNISYDRFLHWNCYDSSFIILGKGNLSLSIDNDTFWLYPQNTKDVVTKLSLATEELFTKVYFQ